MTLLGRTLPLLSALALALTVGACACAGTNQIQAGSFRLLPQQSVELSPCTTLSYDSVSDSRCPPDAKCVWAGALSYRFTLAGTGFAESFVLDPAQLDYTSPVLHGGRIVLDQPPSLPRAPPRPRLYRMRSR
jgi:hypothetical protein